MDFFHWVFGAIHFHVCGKTQKFQIYVTNPLGDPLLNKAQVCTVCPALHLGALRSGSCGLPRRDRCLAAWVP